MKYLPRINQLILNKELPEIHDISNISNIRKADNLKYKGIHNPLDLKGLVNLGGKHKARAILPSVTNIWEIV